MLIACNIIHLHFPRVLFHRVLYLWALRASFSKGPPWGYFPSGTVVDHPQHIFFWHFLNHAHIQNQSRPPDILPVNVKNIYLFLLEGGGACGSG